MRDVATGAALLVALTAAPLPGTSRLAGQAAVGGTGAVSPDEARDTTAAHARVLDGRVVDAATGLAIAGAAVRMERRPGTLTDAEGRFRLEGLEAAEYELSIRQFGYVDLVATVVPPRFADVLVEIHLTPSPVAVDGITAVVDRLATMDRRLAARRNAAPVSVRTYGQERLLRSGAATMYDFLLRQPAVHPTTCVERGSTGLCFLRRGRVIRPRVVIDEVPSLGGFDELSTYDPGDIYLVEVYSGGIEVRAYTYSFMERMARRPMALIPWLGW